MGGGPGGGGGFMLRVSWITGDGYEPNSPTHVCHSTVLTQDSFLNSFILNLYI